ncbi:class I SAM-dependent methyltransferase [Pseudaminobacter sp. 19-2017]|uniref:Class I SAM-dependent methyltransferase n=1 Tax=Pseudaminobacter soli (ex Zhang et al. 2022) TaxID=2831468 RepID=A0A942IAM0_9HYPH|nr:cyclopropane-fatty-acyl-phospholipid synthase family protein [Pseudaminobacter soli]MBS3650631.1 class I SAM-dependent methyltransferase [Pseudaminobacter soli]
MNILLRRVVDRVVRVGNLKITGPDGSVHSFGDGSGPLVHVHIKTTHAERAITLHPSLAVGEAFMDQELDFLEGDVLSFLHLIYENTGPMGSGDALSRAMEGVRVAIRGLHQMNTHRRSKRNVERHYDLSGEMYKLFLDEDMQYSCAYFERPDMTLEEAQLAKKRHIAAKLRLKQGQSVLDIGCGWGGLGLYIARNFQADVLGVTLSKEQHAIATERARAEGLDSHAHFEIRDYRDLNERFDRIVSVGMFEHVGVNHYRTFFEKCATLLKPDGVMLLHSIGRFGPPTSTNAFIRKHIFPGGYIPALSEVLPAIEKAGLMVGDIEILRIHYAETLKAWRERFMANRDKAKAIYDERFCRMWEFYLSGSEAAFRWQDMMVFQIQLTRKNDAVPITRGYMEKAEKALAMHEMGHQPGGAEAKPKRGRKKVSEGE